MGVGNSPWHLLEALKSLLAKDTNEDQSVRICTATLPTLDAGGLLLVVTWSSQA
jgi:hypothetical protein